MSESSRTEEPSIDPAELARRLRGDDPVSLLDVRDRGEFEEWHVTGPAAEATQIPHQKFVAAGVAGSADDLVSGLAEPVVVVCAVGRASGEVAGQLRESGVDAVNLAGGMAAWADHYESVDLPSSSATIRQYRRPSSGCLAYLVVSGDEAAVIDPLRAFADRYVEDADSLGASLRYAVDTHVHADHVSGVRALAATTGAEIVLPAGASERGLDFGDEFDPRLVRDGDELRVGDAALSVEHLPGHTSELVGFRLRGDEGDLLFDGDTLFLVSVARPDLEVDADGVESMARRLHGSLRRILDSPDATRIAPGHVGETTRPDEDGAYVATVDELRERLDLLSLDEDEFAERITESMPTRPANYERIVAVNLGRESADDETAAELELGPNHCAVG